MAARLEPPKSLLCHSHWTVDGEKMSKSKNNVVCPSSRSEIYTTDAFRYFLLREGVAHSDGSRYFIKIQKRDAKQNDETCSNVLHIVHLKTDNFILNVQG